MRRAVRRCHGAWGSLPALLGDAGSGFWSWEMVGRGLVQPMEEGALAGEASHPTQGRWGEWGNRCRHLHEAQQRGADLVLGLQVQRQQLRGEREHLRSSGAALQSCLPMHGVKGPQGVMGVTLRKRGCEVTQRGQTLRSASGGAAVGCVGQCRPSLSMRAVTCTQAYPVVGCR